MCCLLVCLIVFFFCLCDNSTSFHHVMGNVEQPVSPPFWSRWKCLVIGWIAILVFSLCGSQRINPDDSGDPQTFLVELQCIWIKVLGKCLKTCEIYQHIWIKFATISAVSCVYWTKIGDMVKLLPTQKCSHCNSENVLNIYFGLNLTGCLSETQCLTFITDNISHTTQSLNKMQIMSEEQKVGVRFGILYTHANTRH